MPAASYGDHIEKLQVEFCTAQALRSARMLRIPQHVETLPFNFSSGFPGSLVADNLEGIIIRVFTYNFIFV